jgi:hypothetical protein
VETEGFEPPTFYRLVLNEQCKANVIPLHHIPFVEVYWHQMRYIMLLRAPTFLVAKSALIPLEIRFYVPGRIWMESKDESRMS